MVLLLKIEQQGAGEGNLVKKTDEDMLIDDISGLPPALRFTQIYFEDEIKTDERFQRTGRYSGDGRE